MSVPYNINIIQNSFPATVKCDVTVDWCINGTLKRAVVHKTFYITSDYKVFGFIDEQDATQVVGYTY